MCRGGHAIGTYAAGPRPLRDSGAIDVAQMNLKCLVKIQFGADQHSDSSATTLSGDKRSSAEKLRIKPSEKPSPSGFA